MGGGLGALASAGADSTSAGGVGGELLEERKAVLQLHLCRQLRGVPAAAEIFDQANAGKKQICRAVNSDSSSAKRATSATTTVVNATVPALN